MDPVRESFTGAWTIAAPCVVFVACAYFTRAPVGRVLAALVSTVAVAGFNIAADVLAYQRGWWRRRRPRLRASCIVRRRRNRRVRSVADSLASS